MDHTNIAVVGGHPHWLPPDPLVLVLFKLNLDIVRYIIDYLQLSNYLCGPDLVLAAPLVADGVEAAGAGDHEAGGGEGGHQAHAKPRSEAEVEAGDGPGLAAQPPHLPLPGQHEAAPPTQRHVPHRPQPGHRLQRGHALAPGHSA